MAMPLLIIIIIMYAYERDYLLTPVPSISSKKKAFLHSETIRRRTN